MDDSVIAIDVGGTTLKGAAFRPDGSLAARHDLPTFAIGGSAADGVRELVRRLVAALRYPGLRPVGVGISCAGLVRDGVVERAVNLSWTRLPLRALLEEEFGLPVVVENDARAAALGEQAALGGQELRDFAFIPIGTGVSAAVVTDGRLVRGAIGAAGEFGHFPVVPGGRPCACGQRGCLEAYASGPSILARYRELGGGLRSTAEIAAGVGADPVARRVWADAVDALAAGIIGLTAVVDPAVVVLGGGVARAGAALSDPLGRLLAARLTWRPVPELSSSTLGSQAGLIGAGILGLGAAGPYGGADGPYGGADGPYGSFAANALAGLTQTVNSTP